jgi:CheY-like chemotaxis protein
VNLVLSAAPNLWPVRIDPSQIDQILANLAANARDAIRGVGTVTIATANVTLHAHECAGQDGLVPGEYVRLSVVDTGSGMDDDTQAHVFEPFYTTKPEGQGIGLGLATVYGIARQNNGLVQLTSALGKGTIVSVYLPRFTGEAPKPSPDASERTPQAGRETILLVEDEPMVLDLSRRLLERLGYRVLTASTPQQALATAAEHAGAIDLLFTDVVMPLMSGPDLATQLVGLYPRMHCLFASGHFAQDSQVEDIVGPGKHFLQKPFSTSELAVKVREALDER